MTSEEPEDGEYIELGPDDQLQESVQDWTPIVMSGMGFAGSVAKIATDHIANRDRTQLDRERLAFEREKFEAEQAAAAAESEDGEAS